MFQLPTLTAKEPTIHETAKADNVETKAYIASIFALNYADVPAWIDDVVSGACGQIDGTQRFSPAKLFKIISCLDLISNETVGEFLNKRRRFMEEPDYSKSYIAKVTAAARCASQGVEHHRQFHKIEEPVYVPKECKPLPYSDSEMAHIKHLSLNASFSELQAYEATLKTKYGLH